MQGFSSLSFVFCRIQPERKIILRMICSLLFNPFMLRRLARSQGSCKALSQEPERRSYSVASIERFNRITLRKLLSSILAKRVNGGVKNVESCSIMGDTCSNNLGHVEQFGCT